MQILTLLEPGESIIPFSLQCISDAFFHIEPNTCNDKPESANEIESSVLLPFLLVAAGEVICSDSFSITW